ncbi:MAG: hypothetical protein WA933_06140 [Microcoleaceae cyanobacterium]
MMKVISTEFINYSLSATVYTISAELSKIEQRIFNPKPLLFGRQAE